MELQITPVSKINDKSTKFKLKVQIDRMWTILDKDSDKKEKMLIDVIFVDEQGTKIQATVRKALVKDFQSILKEGDTYNVSNFKIVLNNGSHVSTSHMHKMYFQFNTIIKTTSPLELKKSAFNFMSFNDIKLRTTKDNNTLMDVIGFVVKIYDVDKVIKLNTTKVNLDIEDVSGVRIKCTLWEGHYERLLKFNKENPDEPIIFILDYAKTQDVGKEKYVSNSMYASRLIFNENLPEINDYRKRLTDIHTKIPAPKTGINSQTRRYIDFDEDVKIKCLEEIPHITKECSCIVVTICDKIESNWFYEACPKCMSKVERSDEEWVCGKCRKYINSIDIRYKIILHASDFTGSIPLCIFDREAFKLVGQTALKIREKFNEEELDIDLPSELKELVGMKFLVHFNITNYNLRNPNSSYTVLKISSDKDLITKILENNPQCKPTSSSIDDNQDLECVEITSRNKRKHEDNNIQVDDDYDVESKQSAAKRLLAVKVEKE